MKTRLLALTLIFLSTNILAQEWIALDDLSATAPKISLTANTVDETTVNFSLGGYYQTAVTTPEGQQYIISAPKMASRLEEGAPDLPLYAIPVLIDDEAAMELRIDDAKFIELSGIAIAPSKGNLSRETDPTTVPYRYGAAYTQNQFYPTLQAELDAPYILRDCRGQNILVSPFAYNPISQTLRVYTELRLTLHKTGEKGDNMKLSRKTGVWKRAPETQALYAERFVNYKENAARYPFVEDAGTMLVICPEAYLDAMQPFVDWKNASGRPTTMVSLEEAGGNNAEQLKAFIRSRYDDPSDNLIYVLLVGDYADITPKFIGGGGSDIWLGQLEGNDYYPEVFVGRFSVGSVADVETHVAKVLYYERDMPAQAGWLSRGVGIGSTEGEGNGHNGGESDCQHIDYIRDTLLHYTYTEVSQHYKGVGVGTNAAMLSENFNNGAGICNYCNHGNVQGWYVGSFTNLEVNALVNDYKWPVVWSTACLNGKFDLDCFAEAWMRATNDETGVPTGAIGGMFSWTSQPWQPPMTGQDEMVDVLCEWRDADRYHHTLAGASLNGNMKILDLYPSDQGVTHNTWILFGDPSLMMRTDVPAELHAHCQPEAIFLGQTELHLTADADYALATLSSNGQTLCTVPVINGEATLRFESPTEVGTAQLVVTGYNKVTHVQTIEIIPANGAFLLYDSFAINSESGQADYGTTFSLDLSIKNIGNEATSNIQVQLVSDSPYIDILDGGATIPSLESMESFTLEDSFLLRVADHVEDGLQAPVTLLCSDGTHTWSSSFKITLHAPVFALTDFRPEDNLVPGESGVLLVSIKNIGSAKAHNAHLELYSSSSDLTFHATAYDLGSIAPEVTTSVRASFDTNGDMINGNSYEILYLVEAESYLLEGVENLNIGLLKETFETGDFSTFDWHTLGGGYWFVTNADAHSGNYCAQSGAIGNANISTLQMAVNVTADGNISFFKKVCTEANKDKLSFYIDSQKKGEWSGEVDWSPETYPVTAGQHTFKWIYLKDSSGSYGEDCCRLDDIQLPAAHTVTFLPSVNMEAAVEQNRVTLTWSDADNADAYLIRRDGQPLALQPETSFTETCTQGSYVYSVVVVSGARMSAPAFAFVEVGAAALPERLSDIALYPNPTDRTLHIAIEEPFCYTLFDGLGRQVSQGANETTLDLGNLPKGLYLMRITTENWTRVQKVMVR